MHDGIVEIGDSAFSGCSALKSIKLPDKITVINDSVFANCKSLANVEIAESVLKIGCSAFSECDAITDINIPCNVTCIESKAFFGCDSLENINFGSNVQTIGSYAFYMCNNLSEIKLPYSIEKIQEAAFGYCKQLTKAVIEKKVNYIARDAFNYPETLIIYGVGGTLAEQYANEIGALFQTIIDMDADTSKYYNVTTNGGSWDGTHYYLPSGQMVRNSFFSEGTYTYYLQADGTPMKDRLTYHPDGVHVIYFDADGHEVFSDFAHISKSIAGADVDDMCFFNVYGYMYVDTLTYDKTGTKLYYVNPYGVLERNGWFQFSGHEFDAGLGFSGKAGGYGYANWDCSLMVDTYTYDWNGNFVYMQGDGHMAQ